MPTFITVRDTRGSWCPFPVGLDFSELFLCFPIPAQEGDVLTRLRSVQRQNISLVVLLSIYEHGKYLSFASQWDSGISLPAEGNRPCHEAWIEGMDRIPCLVTELRANRSLSLSHLAIWCCSCPHFIEEESKTELSACRG